MFDSTSRYAKIATTKLTVTDRDGTSREIRYVRRRFLPASDEMPTLVEHTGTQGERLDRITARYVGDPAQFWRVCDANNVLRPDELTDEVGRVIRIALARE
jgi:hypothetical protein